jgi:hypothetical protein
LAKIERETTWKSPELLRARPNDEGEQGSGDRQGEAKSDRAKVKRCGEGRRFGIGRGA